MTPNHEVGLYIFLLAGFLGYHVISRVPPLLHTPLMSATNAISGISLIGSLVVCGSMHDNLSTFLGFVAVTCSSVNVVGGFLITDRMLKMFKSERDAAAQRRLFLRTVIGGGVLVVAAAISLIVWWDVFSQRENRETTLRYLYIGSAVLFILGLKGLSSPKYARTGMFAAGLGMFLAIVGTLFEPDLKPWGYLFIFVGLLIGSVVGGMMGLRIPMTAVPQRTALSHSLGALAATLIGISEYLRHGGVISEDFSRITMTALGFEVVIGGLTFTGSLMAAAKLQELLPGRPITYPGQNASNFTLLAAMIASLVYLIFVPSTTPLFFLLDRKSVV